MLHSLRSRDGRFRKKDASMADAYKEYAKAVDKESTSTPVYDAAEQYLKAMTRPVMPMPPIKMKRETYSLNEGDVTISCPAKLSWKSSNELEEIFKLFIKRVEKGS